MLGSGSGVRVLRRRKVREVGVRLPVNSDLFLISCQMTTAERYVRGERAVCVTALMGIRG